MSANRVYEGPSFIQCDVAIDHGDSGGPLLDDQGRAPGITQWTYSPDGVSHNLNFFIPIDDALRVLALRVLALRVLALTPAAAPHAGSASAGGAKSAA
jgi:hypothetical protein